MIWKFGRTPLDRFLQWIQKKGWVMAEDLTEDQFKQRLREAGWSEEDIKQEWENIQNDDESGYDGP